MAGKRGSKGVVLRFQTYIVVGNSRLEQKTLVRPHLAHIPTTQLGGSRAAVYDEFGACYER